MNLRNRMLIPFIVVLYVSLLSLGWSGLQIIDRQNRERTEHYLMIEAEKSVFYFSLLREAINDVEAYLMSSLKTFQRIPPLPPDSAYTVKLSPLALSDLPDNVDKQMFLDIKHQAGHYFLDLVMRRRIELGYPAVLTIRRNPLRPVSALLNYALNLDFLIIDARGTLKAVSVGREIMPFHEQARQLSSPLSLSAATLRKLRQGEIPPLDRQQRYGDQMIMFVPILFDNELMVIIGLLYPVQRMDQALRSFTYLTIIVLSLVTVVLSAIYYSVTNRGNRFIAELIDFCRRVSEGDFSKRLSVGGRGDMTTLSMILNDMSESLEKVKNYERHLMIVDRLSSLAQLSTGIAHEIKNPLMVVWYAARHLKKDTMSDRDLQDIEMIEKNISRIEQVVRKLADFSRPSAVEETKELLDLNAIFSESLYFLRKAFEINEIKLHYEPYSDPLISLVLKRYVGQVFTNVLMNALEALPDGGMVTVETTIKEGTAGVSMAVFTITDSGPGIDEKNRSEVFNPFFTTKPHGTGLGLAISHQVMRDHGGYIEIVPASEASNHCETRFNSDIGAAPRGTSVRIGFILSVPENNGDD